MGVGSAYLVTQDWGSGLAFHLAERRPGFVRGLAFMEFIHPFPTWEVFLRGSKAREIFRKFRTPGEGEKLILENNAFVELMQGAIRRKLTDEEMAVYRAPFPTPQSRKPTWRFPNELPIAGEPADVYSAMERAHAALAASTYPKLLFAAEPGALVPPAFAEELAHKLHDCRFVKLGDGPPLPARGSP
jgi:haloalkane dehalogenase